MDSELRNDDFMRLENAPQVGILDAQICLFSNWSWTRKQRS
jgi:hypothetical protein